MAVQRFQIVLLAVAAVAAGVLLTDPALAQDFPSNTDHSRDDPDAYAQGWRRTAYEPAQRDQSAERAGEAKKDFVSELLGPAAESVRRMPTERPRSGARAARSSPSSQQTTLAVRRAPEGQDPSLIFE